MEFKYAFEFSAKCCLVHLFESLGQKTTFTLLASVVRRCGAEELVSDPVYGCAVVLRRNILHSSLVVT